MRVPTVFGPCPVIVSLPCLSVYFVLHSFLIFYGCVRVPSRCASSVLASSFPLLISVDDVFLISKFMLKVSFAASSLFRLHSTSACMCVSVISVQ